MTNTGQRGSLQVPPYDSPLPLSLSGGPGAQKCSGGGIGECFITMSIQHLGQARDPDHRPGLEGTLSV